MKVEQLFFFIFHGTKNIPQRDLFRLFRQRRAADAGLYCHQARVFQLPQCLTDDDRIYIDAASQKVRRSFKLSFKFIHCQQNMYGNGKTGRKLHVILLQALQCKESLIKKCKEPLIKIGNLAVALYKMNRFIFIQILYLILYHSQVVRSTNTAIC